MNSNFGISDSEIAKCQILAKLGSEERLFWSLRGFSWLFSFGEHLTRSLRNSRIFDHDQTWIFKRPKYILILFFKQLRSAEETKSYYINITQFILAWFRPYPQIIGNFRQNWKMTPKNEFFSFSKLPNNLGIKSESSHLSHALIRLSEIRWWNTTTSCT